MGVIVGWSSLVARQAHNLKVVGSNPTPATSYHFVMHREIKTDIDVIFKVDKSYPVSILKIYTKAKVLPNIQG